MKLKRIFVIILFPLISLSGCKKVIPPHEKMDSHMITEVRITENSRPSAHFYSDATTLQFVLDCLRRMNLGAILSNASPCTADSIDITLFCANGAEMHFKYFYHNIFYDGKYCKKITAKDSATLLGFLSASAATAEIVRHYAPFTEIN